MRFDKFPTGRYLVYHKQTENTVCFCCTLNGNLFEGTGSRVHRGFPKLAGIHFTQSLVSLHTYTVFLTIPKPLYLQAALILSPGIGAVFSLFNLVKRGL